MPEDTLLPHPPRMVLLLMHPVVSGKSGYWLDDVASVLLVGSIVKSKGVYKQKKSGIDLIVLINEKSSDYKIIKRLREVGLDFYLSDDIFILKGTLISIYIEMYNSYVKYLESIITSEAMEIVLKDWTIGGVCKEVILDDIANAKIFLTKEEILPSYHIN